MTQSKISAVTTRNANADTRIDDDDDDGDVAMSSGGGDDDDDDDEAVAMCCSFEYMLHF